MNSNQKVDHCGNEKVDHPKVDLSENAALRLKKTVVNGVFHPSQYSPLKELFQKSILVLGVKLDLD